MLYHGSKKLVSKLKRSQAWSPNSKPKGENLNAIYFTPDFALALAFAARPENEIKIDHKERVVYFRNPEKFDSEKDVYVYSIDPAKIPDEKKIWVDEWQIAVDLDEIEPDKVEKCRAGDIYQYYILGGKE